MASIRREVTIAASPEAVWDAVRDVGAGRRPDQRSTQSRSADAADAGFSPQKVPPVTPAVTPTGEARVGSHRPDLRKQGSRSRWVRFPSAPPWRSY